MTLQTGLMIVFSVLMVLNAIALIRFWRMMLFMNATLRGFIETNRQFGELLDRERSGT